MAVPPQSWYHLAQPETIPSPSLLVFPDRARENVRRMIRMAGGTDRLRPHVKTHKMPDIMALMMEEGLTRFKCATLAELEMCARAGVPDALLAYPPVGPNVQGLLQLIRAWPETRFSVAADDASVLARLDAEAGSARVSMTVFLDLDCGQHRTGVKPGAHALDLYRQIHQAHNLVAGGLHIYDGHLHDPDPDQRHRNWKDAMAPCWEFHDQLQEAGLDIPRVVAGGTPTFPFHAKEGRAECSPGTCVFWDAGYGQHFKDLNFEPAALVFTRIISKPGPRHLCLDLGHKSIASENPHPRVIFPDLADARAVAHSEEHLVLETEEARNLDVGQGLCGIPWHICPTVALYGQAIPISNHQSGSPWKISARERRWHF